MKVWRCGYGGGWVGVGGWDVKVWRCGYGGGWGRCGRMGCEGMEVWG